MMQCKKDNMLKITRGTKPKYVWLSVVPHSCFINDVTARHVTLSFFLWGCQTPQGKQSRSLSLHGCDSAAADPPPLHCSCHTMCCSAQSAGTHQLLHTSIWLRRSDEDKGTKELLLAQAQLLNTNTRESADTNSTVSLIYFCVHTLF